MTSSESGHAASLRSGIRVGAFIYSSASLNIRSMLRSKRILAQTSVKPVPGGAPVQKTQLLGALVQSFYFHGKQHTPGTAQVNKALSQLSSVILHSDLNCGHAASTPSTNAAAMIYSASQPLEVLPGS